MDGSFTYNIRSEKYPPILIMISGKEWKFIELQRKISYIALNKAEAPIQIETIPGKGRIEEIMVGREGDLKSPLVADFI